ncbi:MAG TPA: nuclear transport factor 2 family protein [Acidimicrobiia bacterium]|nr:nuclear transport factor 2 family protein [Acidimicrobiia bacterium]
MTSTVEAVRAANAAFYAAFEARDLDAMAEVWERTERASVTHPGWPRLSGWGRVAGSWDAIFRHTPFIQFVLTDERVDVVGDTAWVTLDENILQAAGESDDGDDGDAPLSGARVAATNVFVRDGDRWQMVMHHGSPVGVADDPVDGEE